MMSDTIMHDELSRTHKIKLCRVDDEGEFGFTIRGGVQHGLGHFVSHVEKGSEAHLQGIRPGDQIIKVPTVIYQCQQLCNF